MCWWELVLEERARMRTGRSPADFVVSVCYGMYRWGYWRSAHGRARGQSGGLRGVCMLWHVPVGALGGARADVRGGFRYVGMTLHVPVGALGGARADVGKA